MTTLIFTLFSHLISYLISFYFFSPAAIPPTSDIIFCKYYSCSPVLSFSPHPHFYIFSPHPHFYIFSPAAIPPQNNILQILPLFPCLIIFPTSSFFIFFPQQPLFP